MMLNLCDYRKMFGTVGLFLFSIFATTATAQSQVNSREVERFNANFDAVRKSIRADNFSRWLCSDDQKTQAEAFRAIHKIKQSMLGAEYLGERLLKASRDLDDSCDIIRHLAAANILLEKTDTKQLLLHLLEVKAKNRKKQRKADKQHPTDAADIPQAEEESTQDPKTSLDPFGPAPDFNPTDEIIEPVTGTNPPDDPFAPAPGTDPPDDPFAPPRNSIETLKGHSCDKCKKYHFVDDWIKFIEKDFYNEAYVAMAVGYEGEIDHFPLEVFINAAGHFNPYLHPYRWKISPPQFSPGLLKYLESADATIRCGAIITLGNSREIGEQDIYTPLLHLLKTDPDSRVRIMAVRWLHSYYETSLPALKKAGKQDSVTERLYEVMENEASADVRYAAMMRLEVDPKGRFAKVMLHDGDPILRVVAMCRLRQCVPYSDDDQNNEEKQKYSGITTTLTGLMSSKEKDKFVRAMAAFALGKEKIEVDIAPAVDLMLEAMKQCRDAEPLWYRYYQDFDNDISTVMVHDPAIDIMHAVANLPQPDARFIPLLIQRLARFDSTPPGYHNNYLSPEEISVQAAYDALLYVAPADLDALKQALAHERIVVRQHVAMILAELAPETEGVLPALVESFQQPCWEKWGEIIDVRADALALAKLGDRGVDAILPFLLDPKLFPRTRWSLIYAMPCDNVCEVFYDKLSYPKTDVRLMAAIIEFYLSPDGLLLDHDQEYKIDQLLYKLERTGPKPLREKITVGFRKLKMEGGRKNEIMITNGNLYRTGGDFQF